MKFTVAKYTVRPETVKELRKAIAVFVAEIRKHEPRTLYAVFRENGQHTFVHWMSFENDAAERRHAQSKYNDRFARMLLRSCVGKVTFNEMNLCAASREHWALRGRGTGR